MKALIYFQPNSRLDNFEGARLRKSIKGALELNDLNYATNLVDDYDVAHFMCVEDELKIYQAEERQAPVIISALYSERDKSASFLECKTVKKTKVETIKPKAIKVLNKADLVLVPSNNAKKYLKENGVTSRIETVAPGVNFARFNFLREDEKELFYRYFKEDNSKQFVVGFGELSDTESVETFLRIAKQCKDTKFYYFGIENNAYKFNHKLKKIVRHAPNNVCFSRRVPEDIYRSVLLNAKAMIVPTNHSLGLITVMDALAAKVQIIARKQQILDDILVDGYNAYVSETVDELATTTNKFLKGNIKPTIEQAFECISQNTLKNFGLKLIELYKKEIEIKKGGNHND